ncbi:hypothetical protein [Desulfovibrio sp. JC010]|uniref:hypothetical protein n=1 Tax=Desulfovibrio sp. JC010 TaxID=2593641 RepID=UPI0013CF9123|nr:hypothetical protein [Desulfovibrio sp. JC010]NDV28720.1 hypothetical protein [Desulfovibrio sp. JC010]
MELFKIGAELQEAITFSGTAGTIVWMLLIQLVLFVLFFALAVRIFRKSVEEFEFSSSFYVVKKRHGEITTEDCPYDYIKH